MPDTDKLLIACLLSLLASGCATGDTPHLPLEPPLPTTAHTGTSGFNGVNWADKRDNFVDGCIVPSGIDHRAEQSEAAAQARTILPQFKSLLGANTVRLGVNPATVRDKNWWPKYRLIITEALTLNFKVILACWESKSSKDGRIDDQKEFEVMWDLLLSEFGDSEQVYFEIFNEPHGYSSEQWRDIASKWIDRCGGRIKGQDRSRILVSGSGYSERLRDVAGDSRLDGCRFSFHLYAWFGGKHKTIAGWKQEIRNRIGETYATRTIVTEWGAQMKNLPQNYYSETSPVEKRNRAYLAAMSAVIADWDMGSIYWPGLRDGDTFSMTERESGTQILRITNQSGKAQLRRSFKQIQSVETK